MTKSIKHNLTIQKALPYVLIIGGVIGCLASFVLTYDKIQVMQNNDYLPSCNINPVLSCGSVMKTEQASLLGVPNTIFGLIAFSMLVTFGVLLASGIAVKKWIWMAAQGAALLGLVFMHYLFFQGVYRINAICPWCFVVWMITIFWYITVYNIRQNNFSLKGRIANLAEFLQKYHIEVLIVWYTLIFAIILERFWYYWSTLI